MRISDWSSDVCSSDLLALLLGYLDAFGRRAEPSEQGEHRQRHDREHGDLAIGIDGPEIDEDDVDDVGAATARTSVLDEIARPALRRAPGHHRIRDRGAPAAPRHPAHPHTPPTDKQPQHPTTTRPTAPAPTPH